MRKWDCVAWMTAAALALGTTMPSSVVWGDEVVEINEDEVSSAVETAAESEDDEDDDFSIMGDTIDDKTKLAYVIKDGGAVVKGYSGGNPDKGVKIEIPKKLGGKKVIRIAKEAFSHCDPNKKYYTTVKSVVIPPTVETIGASAFEFQNLKKVTFSEPEKSKLTVIKDSAFAYNDELKSISLPDSVTTIGDSAFRCNTSGMGAGQLTRLVLPAHLQTIGEYAFQGHSDLSEVVFGKEIISLGHASFHHAGLRKVQLPNTCTNLSGAFQSNQKLEEFIFPNKITESRDDFFYCSSLKKIYVPKSMKIFAPRDFENSNSLTDVYYQGSEEEWNAIQRNDEFDNYVLKKATKHFHASLADFGAVDDPADPYGDPTPKPAPAPTPAPTPTPTPEPEPTPAPDPTPEPTPTPEPEPTPEPTPAPDPTPEPEPTPEPAPTPTPSDNTVSPNKPEPVPTPSENTVSPNKPEKTVINKDGFEISYYSEVPFSGKKMDIKSFDISVNKDGKSYSASKLKVNKKSGKIQIKKMMPVDKKTQKTVKKLTKGNGGLDFKVTAYTVSSDSPVTAKFTKKGELKSVFIKFGESIYKCDKDEYDYDNSSKTITFKGSNLIGKYVINKP